MEEAFTFFVLLAIIVVPIHGDFEKSDWTVSGKTPGERFGHKVLVSDIVQGLEPDIIVGSPSFGIDGSEKAEQGRVTIYLDVTIADEENPQYTNQILESQCKTVTGSKSKSRSFFGETMAAGKLQSSDSKSGLLVSMKGCTTKERKFVPIPIVSSGVSSSQEFDWGDQCSSNIDNPGEFQRLIAKNANAVVGIIPEGKANVSITMVTVGGKDVDMHLDDLTGRVENGKQKIVRLVGYYPINNNKGINQVNNLNADTTCTCNSMEFEDKNDRVGKLHSTEKTPNNCAQCALRDLFVSFSLRYSGHVCRIYGTTKPGSEWIDVIGTTTVPLRLSVRGYEQGDATVRYTYESGCTGSSNGRIAKYAGTVSSSLGTPTNIDGPDNSLHYSLNHFGSDVGISEDYATVATAIGSVGGTNVGMAWSKKNSGEYLSNFSVNDKNYPSNLAYGYNVASGKFGTTSVGEAVFAISALRAPRPEKYNDDDDIGLSYAGKVEVVTSDLKLVCRVYGETFAAGFGASVVGIRFKGSYDWLVVGAPFYSDNNGLDDSGRVYIYEHLPGEEPFGKTPSHILSGDVSNGAFGWALSNLGDTNGDGIPDLAVSAPYAKNGIGRIYIYYGTGSGIDTKKQQTINGDQNGGHFGYSMSAGVDLGGTPYPDIVVGEPGYNEQRGRVVVLSGLTNARLVLSIEGPTNGDGTLVFYMATENGDPSPMIFSVVVTNNGPDTVPPDSVEIVLDFGTDEQSLLTNYPLPTSVPGCEQNQRVYNCKSIPSLPSGSNHKFVVHYDDRVPTTNYPYVKLVVVSSIYALEGNNVTLLGSIDDHSVTQNIVIEHRVNLQYMNLPQITAYDDLGAVVIGDVKADNEIRIDDVRFKNIGKSTAFGVLVVATLPPSFRYKENLALTCAGVRSLRCSKIKLDAGEEANFTSIAFGLDQSGISSDPFKIDFMLFHSGANSYPVNITSNSLTPAPLTATLSTSRSRKPTGDVFFGRTVVWEVTVTNQGPAAASSVLVEITSPQNTTVVADTATVLGISGNFIQRSLTTIGNVVTLNVQMNKGASIKLAVPSLINAIKFSSLNLNALSKVTSEGVIVAEETISCTSPIVRSDYRLITVQTASKVPRDKNATVTAYVKNLGPTDERSNVSIAFRFNNTDVPKTYHAVKIENNEKTPLRPSEISADSTTIFCVVGALSIHVVSLEVKLTYLVPVDVENTFQICVCIDDCTNDENECRGVPVLRGVEDLLIDTVLNNNAKQVDVNIDNDVSVSVTMKPNLLAPYTWAVNTPFNYTVYLNSFGNNGAFVIVHFPEIKHDGQHTLAYVGVEARYVDSCSFPDVNEIENDLGFQSMNCTVPIGDRFSSSSVLRMVVNTIILRAKNTIHHSVILDLDESNVYNYELNSKPFMASAQLVVGSKNAQMAVISVADHEGAELPRDLESSDENIFIISKNENVSLSVFVYNLGPSVATNPELNITFLSAEWNDVNAMESKATCTNSICNFDFEGSMNVDITSPWREIPIQFTFHPTTSNVNESCIDENGVFNPNFVDVYVSVSSKDPIPFRKYKGFKNSQLLRFKYIVPVADLRMSNNGKSTSLTVYPSAKKVSVETLILNYGPSTTLGNEVLVNIFASNFTNVRLIASDGTCNIETLQCTLPRMTVRPLTLVTINFTADYIYSEVVADFVTFINFTITSPYATKHPCLSDEKEYQKYYEFGVTVSATDPIENKKQVTSSNSTGLIIGIVVSVLVVLLIGAGLWKFGFFKRREKPPNFSDGYDGYGDDQGAPAGDDV